MIEQTLIDKYLPDFTFNEFHEIIVNRPIEEVYRVAKNIDLSKSKVIKFLFKLRCLPTKRMNLQDVIFDLDFSNLEEIFPKENLMGFWARSKIEPIKNHNAFVSNDISARLKVVWNFRFIALNSTQTKVSTETRVLCISSITKVLFGLYWLIIKPFSGIIREKMLQIIKQDSEIPEGSG